MKKVISIMLVVVLLLAVMVILTGCGSIENTGETKQQDLNAIAGTYNGKYTKLVGTDKKNETESFTLELKADGTGIHHRNDLDIRVKWSITGENFKMTETFMGATIDYTGTLKNGILDIFNGEPTDIWTYEYVFEKQ